MALVVAADWGLFVLRVACCINVCVSESVMGDVGELWCEML